MPAGLLVADATEAYEVSVANGAQGVRPPTRLEDGKGGVAVVSEVEVYGDVVLRYISGKWEVSNTLPSLTAAASSTSSSSSPGPGLAQAGQGHAVVGL